MEAPFAKSKISATMIIVVVAAAVVAGCGSSGSGTTTVVTVVKEAPAAQTPAKQDAAASTSSDSLVDDQGTGGSTGSGRVRVPDEVGKNHQAAQDDLQAHGLYNLAEEDATGQGRMLILDRNWKVVAQSPAPGSMVSEDATITLKSKKYTD
jgi:hypothetical protein